jgi:hypothetical protein
MNAYIKLHLMLNLKQQMLLQMVMAMDLLNEMGDNALPFFFIFLLSFRKFGYFTQRSKLRSGKYPGFLTPGLF